MFLPYIRGQDHDSGSLTIQGVKYQITDVQKAGKAILHYVDKELPADIQADVQVEGSVDPQRRYILRNHHTATHIMYASARKILGPHVWQHGAKKTSKYAHLDITHYRALSQEEELAIETEANKVVFSCTPITKYNLPKEEAEQKYGFSLYQGGAVPGNSLRVVDIAGIDQEACCGTHCENTSQVGLIKIITTNRISDGTVRLTYVAGDLALEQVAQQTRILNELQNDWKVTRRDIVSTADRFFDGYKKYGTKVKKQALQIDQLALSYFLLDEKRQKLLIVSDEPTATQSISILPQFASKLKAKGKSVIVLGTNWVYAIFGDSNHFEEEKFKKAIEESRTFVSRSQKNKKADKSEETAEKKKEMPLIVKKTLNVKEGKQKVTVTDIVEVMGSVPQLLPVMNYVKSLGFEEEPLLSSKE